MEPDLAGFQEAQVRLVSVMGSDVDFYFAPSGQVYASGTYIDPETNLPLDPLITELSQVEFPTVTARCMFVRNPTNRNQGSEQARFGIAAEGEVWLRVPAGTFDPSILRSNFCEAFGEKYQIARRFYDGIASEVDTLYMQCFLTNALDINEMFPIDGEVVVVGPISQETFISTDGQDTFAMATAYVAGSTEVYLDGLRMSAGPTFDYVESGAAIIFNFPLAADQIVVVAYRVPEA